jgi:hypothetical protein
MNVFYRVKKGDLFGDLASTRLSRDAADKTGTGVDAPSDQATRRSIWS